MTDFYLARQPICDKNTCVIGYELLHHRNELNPGQIDYGDRSTSQILISVLLDIGISEVVEDKLAFINITRDYILGEIPFPLARKQIVLEVFQDILPEEEILFALRQFKLRNAYQISLDGFEFDWFKQELAPMADYIKLDVAALSETEIEEQFQFLQNFNGQLIANNVDDQEVFEYCKELGFDLFQGFYFCRPQLLTNNDPQNSSHSNQLRLIAELQSPQINYSKLQALVARDVTLTTRVLRYINSAKFHLARPVETIQQAISLLGLKTITTWITILVLARFDHKPEELLTLALIRAKMCETLAKHAKLDADSCLITGLLSTLDAMLDKDMPSIAKELPLNNDAISALEQQTGPLGMILGMVIAYEQAKWHSDFISSTKNSNKLTATYLEAITWARDIKLQLLRAE